eukprot:TRINITY_DN2871_c0_g3_i1.p1 TRINITY_DN2871_c0_g3~~TRINITY_DN2871_c0_g3_i1.p1  ORF type:complete len:904 (+),score=190.20 TRINITY_DN2871_c0_g3_i1:81-2792(+)
MRRRRSQQSGAHAALNQLQVRAMRLELPVVDRLFALWHESRKRQGDHISVAVRVRPLPRLDQGAAAGRDAETCARVCDGSIVVDGRSGMQTEVAMPHLHGPEAGQEEVYAVCAKRLLSAALAGANCCILAYGQTGSGKTHTMLGDLQPPPPSRVPAAARGRRPTCTVALEERFAGRWESAAGSRLLIGHAAGHAAVRLTASRHLGGKGLSGCTTLQLARSKAQHLSPPSDVLAAASTQVWRFGSWACAAFPGGTLWLANCDAADADHGDSGRPLSELLAVLQHAQQGIITAETFERPIQQELPPGVRELWPRLPVDVVRIVSQFADYYCPKAGAPPRFWGVGGNAGPAVRCDSSAELPPEAGIIPRLCRDLFSHADGLSFEATYIEIYNEQVFDLLSAAKSAAARPAEPPAATVPPPNLQGSGPVRFSGRGRYAAHLGDGTRVEPFPIEGDFQVLADGSVSGTWRSGGFSCRLTGAYQRDNGALTWGFEGYSRFRKPSSVMRGTVFGAQSSVDLKGHNDAGDLVFFHVSLEFTPDQQRQFSGGPSGKAAPVASSGSGKAAVRSAQAHLGPRVQVVPDVSSGGWALEGVQAEAVGSFDEVHRLLADGAKVRATSSTRMNDRSSRSHAVFTLWLRRGRSQRTKVHLVDLAGSERSGLIHEHHSTGQQEGIHINSSLLTLGRVVSALASDTRADEDGDPDDPPPAPYVPYRESVLTQLLRDSLGGTAQTHLIATVSPDPGSAAETVATLRYAENCVGLDRLMALRNSPALGALRALVRLAPLHDEVQPMRVRIDLASKELSAAIRALAAATIPGRPAPRLETIRMRNAQGQLSSLQSRLSCINDQLAIEAQQIYDKTHPHTGHPAAKELLSCYMSIQQDFPDAPWPRPRGLQAGFKSGAIAHAFLL